VGEASGGKEALLDSGEKSWEEHEASNRHGRKGECFIFQRKSRLWVEKEACFRLGKGQVKLRADGAKQGGTRAFEKGEKLPWCRGGGTRNSQRKKS